MLKTVELLDLAKKHQNVSSDYALAKLLGVTPNHISGYRRRGTTPANPTALRLGELCGLNPAEVVSWVNLERYSSGEELLVWREILRNINQNADAELLDRPIVPLPNRDNLSPRQVDR